MEQELQNILLPGLLPVNIEYQRFKINISTSW